MPIYSIYEEGVLLRLFYLLRGDMLLTITLFWPPFSESIQMYVFLPPSVRREVRVVVVVLVDVVIFLTFSFLEDFKLNTGVTQFDLSLAL